MSKNKTWSSAFKSLFIETEEGPTAGGDDEEVDLDALLAETRAMTASQSDEAPAPPPAPAPVQAPVDDRLTIGQSLPELYETYQVPKSPKTVEEIMTFLEGLKAMPETVQHQALEAMDNADPNWTLADVVQDGRNKVNALTQAKGSVQSQVAAATASTEAEVAAQDKYLADAKGTIDEQVEALTAQIEELKQLLAAEQTQVDERKEAAKQSLSDLVVQANTEQQRIDKEIERLSSLVRVFSPMAKES